MSKCKTRNKYAIEEFTVKFPEEKLQWSSKEEYHKLFGKIYKDNINALNAQHTEGDIQSLENKQRNLKMQIEEKLGGPVGGELSVTAEPFTGTVSDNTTDLDVKAATGNEKSLLQNYKKYQTQALKLVRSPVLYHVTTVEEDDRNKFAFKDFHLGAQLGAHVGPKEMAKVYIKEGVGFSSDKLKVYAIALNKLKNPLILIDPAVEWTADSIIEANPVRSAQLGITKDMTDSQIKGKIVKAGYDFVAYENLAEKTGNDVAAIIVLDPNTDTNKVLGELVVSPKEQNKKKIKELNLEKVLPEFFNEFEKNMGKMIIKDVIRTKDYGYKFQIYNEKIIKTDHNLMDKDGRQYTMDESLQSYAKTKEANSPIERARTSTKKLRNEKGEVLFANNVSKESYKEKKLKQYKEVEDVTFNDIESIKKLANDLNEVSENKLSDTHMQHLMWVLDTYVGEAQSIIPEMRIKLNNHGDMNFGAFVPYGKKRGIYISTKEGDKVSYDAQNPAERLVHEVLHAATYFAIESKDSDVADAMYRLQKLHTQVIDKLTWQDLLPSGKDYITKEEEHTAKEVLIHLQGANGFHEFLALGLTNETLSNKLKTLEVTPGKFKEAKNALEALKFMFVDILNAILGIVRREPRGQKAYELMAKLIVDLASANNKALRSRRKLTIGSKVRSKMDQVNTYIATKFDDYEKKTGSKPFPKKPINATKLQTAAWVAKNMWRFFNDPQTRPYYENALTAIGLSPDGVFRQLLDAFSKDDEFKQKVETLGLLSTDIDAKREEVATITTNMLVEAFSSKISKSENIALKEAIVDLDVQSLLTEYTPNEVMELLKDKDSLENALNKEYSKLKKSIKEDNYTSTQAQIKGLAEFMVAGISKTPNQMLNAKNINTLVAKPKKQVTETEQTIDRLATLEAIRKVDDEYKNVVNDLYGKEPDGVLNLLQIHRAFVAKSKIEAFNNENVISNLIKGYTKDIFDEDISLQVNLISKEKELYKEGWDLVNKLNPNKNVVTDQYGVYINKMHVIQNYNRQAFRTTDTRRSGTSITDLERAKGLKDSEVTRRVAIIVRKHPKGIPGMIPVFDQKGNIIDYRYMMSKERKRTLMKQDRRATYTLGRMYASLLDKKASKEMNNKVVKAVIEDTKKNYDPKSNYGKNGKEYTLIKLDADNPKHREFYRILPNYTRTQLNKEFPDGIPIRSDLVRMFFGDRNWSIANLSLFKIMPREVTSAVKIAEDIWKDIVKIYKVDIIIKTPVILVRALASNLMLLKQYGVPLLDVFKLPIQGYHAVTDYQKTHKQMLEIQTRLQVAELKGGNTKALKLKLEGLKAVLQRNSAYPLLSRGLFTSIVDDVDPENSKSGSKLVRKFEDKFATLPKFVKVAGNWLFLTEKTWVYKKMLYATQLVDFLGRYAMFHSGVNKDLQELKRKGLNITTKMKQGIEDKWAHTALMAFLNFNKRGASSLEYAEDMGLIMFTKFFIGIQKVIKQGVRDHPLDFALVAAAQSLLNTNVDDVTDANWWDKKYGYLVYNPVDIATEVLTPGLADAFPRVDNALVNGFVHN